jgi:hypothetical protein
MKFQATLLALLTTSSVIANPVSLDAHALEVRAYRGPVSTSDVCPQARDLWHLTTNNNYY